jgi:alkanesulfonate monooxygenase SsuD/methylene tetrahydromethanopterin reductase-like flavin-dependent oxidoreductase (luciferase family)
MQFWSGTAFMDTAAALRLAPLLDEAGFDGLISADHLVYPRDLKSKYPSPEGVPPWQPETAWPDSWVLIGAMAALTTRLRFSNAIYVAPSRPLVAVAKLVATASVISAGRVSLAVGARGIRAAGPGFRHPRCTPGRDDPGAARTVARWVGVLARRALPGA